MASSVPRDKRPRRSDDDSHMLFCELAKPLDGRDVLRGLRSLSERLASPVYRRNVGRLS